MGRREGLPMGGGSGRTLAGLLGALGLAGLVACGGGSSPGGAGAGPARAGSPARPERFGFGTPATRAQIEAWDIDVGPDGEGLPPGQGTVQEGSKVYARACAHCHGATGVEGPYNVLVGSLPRDSFPFARDPEIVATIGNYWPYATTVFDYIRRSMPFDDPGSLSDEQVYALTAWLLWRNGLIDEDAVMDAKTLPAVEMPAKSHFVPSRDVSLDSLP